MRENKFGNTSTVCLIVIVLLVFILSSGAFVYSQLFKLTQPLAPGEEINDGEILLNSKYAQMQIIELAPDYTILRDYQTDVLYMEFKRNGYSSAITVLLNEDGTPKTYSQFIDG